MVVNYLKDVSTVLAIVSAVRTRNITQHLQAGRQMLKLIFVFDHISYVRYNSFQHVFLSKLSKYSPQAFDDLLNMVLELHPLVKLLVQFAETWLQSTLIKKVKERLEPLDQSTPYFNMVNKWIVTRYIQLKLCVV